MTRKISQHEARELRKKVRDLTQQAAQQRSSWASQFPGGTHIGTINRDHDWLSGRIEAARMLGHAVVVTAPNSDGKLEFFALPLARSPE